MKNQLKVKFFEFWLHHLYFYAKIQSADPIPIAGLSVCLTTKFATLKSDGGIWDLWKINENQ